MTVTLLITNQSNIFNEVSCDKIQTKKILYPEDIGHLSKKNKKNNNKKKNHPKKQTKTPTNQTKKPPTKIPLKHQVTRFLTRKLDFTNKRHQCRKCFCRQWPHVVANWAELNTKGKGAEDIEGIGRKIPVTGDTIKAPLPVTMWV